MTNIQYPPLGPFQKRFQVDDRVRFIKAIATIDGTGTVLARATEVLLDNPLPERKALLLPSSALEKI
jgi:hypothetical protein